jgi:hypothetical protein
MIQLISSRDVVRRSIAAFCALAAAVAVAGCAANQPAPAPSTSTFARPPASTAVTAAPGTVVMVIRHGEKPAGTDDGIDASGNPDSHSLTPRGWERARALVTLFDPRPGTVKAGLARPLVIYAAGGTGEGTRPRETVQPLADHLGIPEDNGFAKGEEAELIGQAATQPGPTLICWQHQEIPAIVAAFGKVTPTPPTSWPSDRFDMVWTFTATSTGWVFAQVPEMVLPGDRPNPLQRS